jgi:hypothetical protein
LIHPATFAVHDAQPARRSSFSLKKASALLFAPVVLLASGCATPSVMRVEAQRYRIDVQIDPASHGIRGQVTMDLVRTGGQDSVPGPVAVELWIHPALKITGVRGAGVDAALIPPGLPTPFSSTSRTAAGEDKKSASLADPQPCWVQLDHAPDSMTLFVSYEGRLYQDISAGEKPGEIHNFQMHAHIGEEGIYLADGYWYPQPARRAGTVPPLAHFTLVAGKVPEMVLVASGDEDEDLDERIGRQVWQSPYPIHKMVLVGGRHEVHRAMHNGVEIAAHLKLSNADQAEGLLAAAKKNLDRYVLLVGPYPARQYTIVENFFSSGFAFPCFTLLSPAVIEMGERGWGRHGYLDHEFMHSWWGAGVYVDPRDGNWSESLASYGANYYGFVLDGDEEGARKKRRNICHFLSRIKAEDDKPLGTYGLPGGCSRSIAYDKGAMVFHMLERRMGEQKFWSALKTFNERQVGEYATWSDLCEVFETATDERLEEFFQRWVYDSKAPVLSADEDPDYHIFHKVPLNEIMPTTASTRWGNAFTAVVPAGDMPAQLKNLGTIFESSFEPLERVRRTPDELIPDEDLAERCVLILGEAARDPVVNAFLAAIDFPLLWTDKGFIFEDQEFGEPGHAVLCTVRHPGVPGGGVTVVYGNSEEAIPRAELIPFYENSMIVFRDAVPILRRDFELRNGTPQHGSSMP